MPAGVFCPRDTWMRKKWARMAQSGAVAGLCPQQKRIWATVFSPGVDYLHSAVTGVLVPTAIFT